jgi:hypothetical protein
MRPHKAWRFGAFARVAGVAALLCGVSLPAFADRIKHPIAVFAGLDKITGRIIAFEVSIDETVQFGSLQVTPRICYTRPQTEAPQTTGFVEVDELQDDRKFKRIFSGWMFAASPGLHGVEHPVYDVWVTDCKGGTEVIRTQSDVTADDEPPPNADVRGPRNQAAPGAPGTQPPKPRRKIDPLAPPGSPGAPPDTLRPPASIPEAPRRAPSQRFFPTDSQPVGRDPAGN